MTVMLDKDHKYASGVSIKESESGGKKILTLRDGNGNEIAKCIQEMKTIYTILGKEPLREGDKEVENSFFPWYQFTNDMEEEKLIHHDIKVWNGDSFVSCVPDGNQDFVNDFFPLDAHLNLANHGKEQLVFALKQKVQTTDKKGPGKIWEVSMAPTADVALIICLAAIMEVTNFIVD